MSAICLSDRRAGTYASLQMHMTGRFKTPPPRPFFLLRATLPVSFPSTNFMRTSMDVCNRSLCQHDTPASSGHGYGLSLLVL